MKRLMISLLLVGLLVPSFCIAGEAEPNNTDAKLMFQLRPSSIQWKVESGEGSDDERRYFTNPGPIQPTHAAEVILHEEYEKNDRAAGVVWHIRNNRLFKELSEAQRAFLDTDLAVWVEDENPCKPHYFSTWLYAVSEADAKLMAQAYLDDLSEVSRKNTERRKGFLADFREKLAQAQRDLSEKQAEFKACQEQFEPLKRGRHEFESDLGGFQKALQTIAEMDRMLDSLEIELAGLHQKAQAIEKYRQGSDEPLSRAVRERLDEMFIELMIELTGLEARRDKTAMIRATEQRFLRLKTEYDELQSAVSRLNEEIKEYRREVDSHTRQLASPPPREQGPKVFQDIVNLYHVYDPAQFTEQLAEQYNAPKQQ